MTTRAEINAVMLRELTAALVRVEQELPRVEAQLVVVSGMAIFTDMMVRHFGIPATLSVIDAMAELGREAVLKASETTKH